MQPKTLTATAVTLTVLVAGLGAALWVQRPELSTRWAASVLFLPGAWLAVLLVDKACAQSARRLKTKHELIRGIASAGGILSLSLIAALAQESYLIDGDVAKRSVGVMLGLLLIFMGNVMPKKLAPLDSEGARAAKTQATQRFVGWLFVVAGLLYATVWMVVDLEQTAMATLLTFPVACLVIVFVRLVYVRATSGNNGSEPSA